MHRYALASHTQLICSGSTSFSSLCLLGTLPLSIPICGITMDALTSVPFTVLSSFRTEDLQCWIPLRICQVCSLQEEQQDRRQREKE